jgi:integrase
MKPKKATATFVLRDRKAPKTVIFLVIRIQDQTRRLKFSTGESIDPKYWDLREKRAKLSEAKEKGGKPTKSNGDAFLKDELMLLNSRLDEYEQVFRRANIELQQNKQEPTLEYFKEELVKKYGGRSEGRILYLTEFVKKYIEIANVRETTKRALRVTEGTLREYEQHIGSRITFDGFKMRQFDLFVQWMHTDKNFAKNTVATRVKNLKSFFNRAFDYGHHTNEAYRKFKVMQEESVRVSLSEKELDLLWKEDLSQNKKLEAIRDTFIIGCRTALRYEDWGRITPEMIDSKARKIRITTSKTLQHVVVPLHWQVEEIWKKYNNKLPRVPSNQKFNDYIKELCERVKINEPVIITRTIGGKIVTNTYKKHELVTTHTARRTAATLWYKAGIDSLAIRKLTGHKDEKSFLKYIKVSEEENADRLLETDYYKAPMRIAE